ncbi:unnamed protein product [Ambrosiozyma monospora]|uniref:Unnamed protein product n=1 Tax=Ambrosiozyma monospora TaxID=43982 RepID=A0ACB5TAQ4_AMBMO|nr:unnamed protein product [Ambrosiozyma monospora]
MALNHDSNDSDTDRLFNDTSPQDERSSHALSQRPKLEEDTIPNLSAPPPEPTTQDVVPDNYFVTNVKEEEDMSHSFQPEVKQESETVSQITVKKERKRSLFLPTPSPKKRKNLLGGGGSTARRIFEEDSPRKTRSKARTPTESEIILISDSEPDENEIIILD